VSPLTLIYDSLALLALGSIAAALFGGVAWALPFALGGLVSVVGLWMLSRLVAAQVAIAASLGDDDSEAPGAGAATRLSLGFMLKTAGTGSAVVGLVYFFEMLPVMLGFGIVLLALTARGAIDLFRTPQEAS
jgi:hypothetical protein